jgi:hypothetical protein
VKRMVAIHTRILIRELSGTSADDKEAEVQLEIRCDTERAPIAIALAVARLHNAAQDHASDLGFITRDGRMELGIIPTRAPRVRDPREPGYIDEAGEYLRQEKNDTKRINFLRDVFSKMECHVSSAAAPNVQGPCSVVFGGGEDFRKNLDQAMDAYYTGKKPS